MLEACRACTVHDPAQRLQCPVEAGRRLTERVGRRKRRLTVPKRVALVAGLVLGMVGGAAAIAVSMVRPAGRRSEDARGPSAPRSSLIVPAGEAADWTQTSAVIVEVPERIHCTRLLPDRRTIRFVWGTPMRAEDIDTVTRARSPSPVVAAASAEGCPDISPDGKRMVYQGHAPDGRAFAFVSQYPDGRDAVAVVQTAEPSMASEPTWLADSDTFSYDVDAKHVAVFSTTLGRMNVLPDVTTRSFITMFRFVVENRVFVGTYFDTRETEIVGITVPVLKEDARFRVDNLALDLRLEEGEIYFTHRDIGRGSSIAAVDVAARKGRALGRIPEQLVRSPMFVGDGLAFVSVRLASDLFVLKPNGAQVNLTRNGHVWEGNRCGRGFSSSAGW